jgi:hypothetical protein
MAGGVEWIFAMLDKASGPASAAEKKLAMLQKRIEGITKAEEKMNAGGHKDKLTFQRLGLEIQRDTLMASEREHGSILKMAFAFNQVLGVAGAVFGAVEGIGSAIAGAAGGAAKIAYSFGKAAVEAASYRETSMIALKVLTGSAEQAERMWGWGVKFAAVTPFETRETLEWMKDLTTGGFKENEVAVIMQAVGDLGAAKGMNRDIMQQLMYVFGKIKSDNKLTGHSLQMLRTAGLPGPALNAKLEEMLHLNKGGAQAAISASQVDAQTAIVAALDVIRTKFSGGVLGNLMDKFSQTIPGLMSTLASRPFEFMVNLDKSKGFAAVKGGLITMLDAVDRSSDKIKDKIASVFNALAVGLFGDLAGPNGAYAADRAITKILASVDALVVGVRAATALTSGFVAGLFEGIDTKDFFKGQLDQAKIDKLTASGREMGGEFGKAATTLGKLVTNIDKVIDGMSALLTVTKVVTGQYWGEKAVAWAKSGDNSGPVAGFAAPEIPSTALVAPPPAPLFRAGAGQVLTIHSTIHAPGATPETAAAIAAEQKKQIWDKMGETLRGEGASLGASQ